MASDYTFSGGLWDDPRVQNDPIAQQLIRQLQSGQGSFVEFGKLQRRVRDLGVSGAGNNLNPQGQAFDNNTLKDWIPAMVAGGLFAAPFIGAAAGAGAAGSTGGSTAAGSLPAATSGVPAGLAAGGSTAVPTAALGGAGPVVFGPTAAAAAPAAAAGGSAGVKAASSALGGAFNWKNMLLGTAANIVTGLIQSHGANKAAEQQIAGAKEAAGQLKDIYAQQVANVSPYTNLGAGAAGLLGKGLGLSPTNPATVQPMTGPQGQAFTTVDPGNPNGTVTNGKAPLVPAKTLADLAGKGGAFGPLAARVVAQNASTSSYTGAGGTVKLRAPDGTIEDVPAAQAQHYISRGAQPVRGV